MNLHINGLHLEITDSLRDYITTKLARINRHSDDIISATITLSTEKVNHKAAAQIHLSGKDVYVETVEKDMYAAIDTLMDGLDRTILQHKERSGRH